MKRPTHKVTKVPNFMHELYSKDRQIFNMPDESENPINYFSTKNDPITGPLDTVRSIANITEVGKQTSKFYNFCFEYKFLLKHNVHKW